MLHDGLRQLQPDIVAFQEAIVTETYDQVVDLLGPGFDVAYQRLGLIGDGNSVAIASRWPLGEVREVDLHLTGRTRDFPCVTLIAEVLAPPPLGPLLVANHIPSWKVNIELERELQAVAAAWTLEDLATQHNAHVILVVDQDADPDAASIRFWTGRQSLGGMSVCYRDA